LLFKKKSTVFLQKLIIAQLVIKFPLVYETLRFITEFKRICTEFCSESYE
jgi:hypothetical protein